MDTKLFIKKLQGIFCDSKKYTEVWLSDVDLGGLYDNGKYILNVKAEHEIDSCSSEISGVLELLDKHAQELLEYIWAVNVLDSNDEVHCASGELLVYTEETACGK